MTHDKAKKSKERRQFEAIAPLLDLDIVPGSIQQPEPKAPDILCECKRNGALAFELVTLDASETRTRINFWLETDDLWEEAISERPEAEQAELRRLLKDLHVSLVFDDAQPLWVRSRDLKKLQILILTEPDLAGDVLGKLYSAQPPARKRDRAQGLKIARLFRGVENGPHITSSSAGGWCFPQFKKIEEKLTEKEYEVPDNRTFELLAYAVHDEPDGHIDSLEKIKDIVTTHLPTSRFDRVAILNLAFGQLLWRTAKPEASR
jgi:hypothetical protein